MADFVGTNGTFWTRTFNPNFWIDLDWKIGLSAILRRTFQPKSLNDNNPEISLKYVQNEPIVHTKSAKFCFSSNFVLFHWIKFENAKWGLVKELDWHFIEFSCITQARVSRKLQKNPLLHWFNQCYKYLSLRKSLRLLIQ